MVPNQQLRPAAEYYQLPPDLRRRYLQAVDPLMYAMLGTRPDLAHVVGVLGQYSARPDQHHWAVVIRACQYIKGTVDYGVKYVPDDLPLAGFEAYSDSDWGADPSTSQSTMGFVFLLLSGAISSSFQIETRVAASSPEAEYIGLSHAGKEAVSLFQLLGKLGHPAAAPTRLLNNNPNQRIGARPPVPRPDLPYPPHRALGTWSMTASSKSPTSPPPAWSPTQ
ncbi:Ty1/Copia family ribonuclease HI [Rhodotorula paludigena]|uniref:Ty1/Copia family ribonuclease HI n=1 Tax=Rhodotorula paludigena TaxID=86838 RepID=UPI00317192CE